jgi:hypothetical protein
LGANQIVANSLVLAKAISVLFNYRPLKGTAMNFRLLFLFIAVGFNQRAANYSTKALAKIQRVS